MVLAATRNFAMGFRQTGKVPRRKLRADSDVCDVWNRCYLPELTKAVIKPVLYFAHSNIVLVASALGL